jgi:acetyl-CoA acyltransferase
VSRSGTTINRLCGSGMDAVIAAARAIKAGEAELMIAGGVESMSRAPFVMPKAETAFSRNAEIYDTTIGWRFVNPLMKKQYGVDSMPETGENVAEDFGVSPRGPGRLRAPQPGEGGRRAGNGRLARRRSPRSRSRSARAIPSSSTRTSIRARATTDRGARQAADALPEEGGTVTAGNASGVNDGAAP